MRDVIPTTFTLLYCLAPFKKLSKSYRRSIAHAYTRKHEPIWSMNKPIQATPILLDLLMLICLVVSLAQPKDKNGFIQFCSVLIFDKLYDDFIWILWCFYVINACIWFACVYVFDIVWVTCDPFSFNKIFSTFCINSYWNCGWNCPFNYFQWIETMLTI